MNRLLLSLGLLASLAGAAWAGQNTITQSEIKKHVAYLASDALEGRGTGSKGERLAGDYLAQEFARYGLRPGAKNGTWFQSFQVGGRARIAKGAQVRIDAGGWYRTLKVRGDFVPFGFSGSLSKTGIPLVFAGYGITDKESGYDDYAGVDVRGKAVLILRHEIGSSQGKIGRNSLFTTKVQNAKAHGAVAMLVVNGPLKDPGDDSLVPFRGGSDVGVFAAHLRLSVIEELFKLMGKDLLAIQRGIDADKKPNSFAMGTLDVEASLSRETVTARNVVGILPGSDPALAKEIVVVGAHYDHLGRGGHGGSLAPRSRGSIHNGADDNASGTAGILELAEAFSQTRPKRTLVFVGFSGEERGLLGSAHFVKDPPFALERIAAMVNLDMIGRLRKDTLEVGGVGTAPTFQALVSKAVEAQGIKGQYSASGFGPSDHASFYRARIPVLFFFTGLHQDYHRPTDDIGLLNAAGAALVARVAYTCIDGIANAAERPKYVAVRRQRRRGRRGARIGIMLGRTQVAKGVPVGRVIPGQAAAKAGLEAGDVIVALGDATTDTTRDLLRALSRKKPGDVVKVKVLRDGAEKTIEVKLGGR